MADEKAEGAKSTGLVAVFGENDGGQAFVALCDTIQPGSIHEVIPQEDVWSTSEAIRNNHAQIAMVPLSNSITQSEAATLAALASGDVKILARVRKQTNHVLVALRDHVIEVDRNFHGSYGSHRGGASSALPQQTPPAPEANTDSGAAPGAATETDVQTLAEPKPQIWLSGDGVVAPDPGPQALSRFVLLLKKVFSSTTVYEQTRGKLTGSDFRHDIQLEHTSNPVRVLLRYFKERTTQMVWNKLEGSQGGPARGYSAPGGYAPTGMPLGGNAPILMPQPQPRPEPIDIDFFGAALVAEGLIDRAHALCLIGPDGPEKQQCSQRLSEVYETLCELKINSRAPRDLPNNETIFLLIGPKNEKLNIDWNAEPKSAPRAWRATFLIKPKNEADWIIALRAFEEKVKNRFPEMKLRFDQAPDRLSHGGKTVLLISARIESSTGETSDALGKAAAQRLGAMLKQHEETLRMSEAGRAASWFSSVLDDHHKFEAKLLGVYPAWVINRETGKWLAEPAAGMAPEKKTESTVSAGGTWAIILFVLFWVVLIFTIAVTSTPFGKAWATRMWSDAITWVQYLIPGKR
jgi:hypothetical protein